MDKKYRTRRGESVKLICVDMKNNSYPVVAIVTDGSGRETADTFTSEGSYINGCQKDYDLIEVSPYEDFEIDEKVLVKGSDDHEWRRRHFAGVNGDGKAMAWNYGGTSFTSGYEEHKTAWDQCKKWSEDDE